MAKITKAQVVEALDQIVSSKPAGYNYQNRLIELNNPNHYEEHGSCVYAIGDAPACIVGQVYYDLTGDLIDDNFQWTGNAWDGKEYMDKFTPAANNYLRLAQMAQDKGADWETAQRYARQGVEYPGPTFGVTFNG